MNLIVLIPARGGSVRIPRKNMQTIGGRTLVSRAIECSPVTPIVSSDDDEIIAEALAHGATVHRRRADLATDEATMDIVARDFIEWYEASDVDLLCILEPSAALRTKDDVVAAINLLRARPDADAIRTVTLVDRPDFFTHWIGASGFLEPTVPKVYRGATPQLFRDNGIANVVRVGALRREGFLFTSRTLALNVEDVERGLDIDWPDDLLRARSLAPAPDEI